MAAGDTMDPTKMRSTYDIYVRGWSNIAEAERRDTLPRAIAADATYADPVSYTHGPGGMADVMTNFQRKTPGGYFVVDQFITQRDRALVFWRALDAEGKLRFTGNDAIIFDQGGLLAQISGFFAKPPGMS